MIRQFGYDQGTTTLIGELSTSTASVAGVRFSGHGVNQNFWEKREILFARIGPDWCEVTRRRALLVNASGK